MYVAWLKDLRMSDLPRVGGKNASLGEMIGGLSRAGVRVPGGYATTAKAFQAFLSARCLDRRIADRIKTLDPRDVDALARCGAQIRGWIEQAPFPADIEKDIRTYYQKLVAYTSGETSFAVRSSATAEDLPDASFAGQQETFLNIRGADHVLAAIRHVFASLYNDRAISYRAHHGFAHGAVAISAAVQRMVRIVKDAAKMSSVKKGDVLVTDMTDPNWEPVMKLAAAIVTNRGGRTCHAAIIARELGIPAVVGCGDATARLAEGGVVTVSCAEGDTGKVYAGAVPFEVTTSEHGQMPRIAVKIAMNIGNPQLAFGFAQLPNAGVGLARLEFIINNEIGVHPKACIDWPELPADLKAGVERAARGYADPKTFFREKMVEGVATIAAAFWPKPVIVRLSDFKSNEYRKLIGGERYEPEEENPMLGFRGAARYIAADFRACFELEWAALRKVRNELGLTNVELMVPFVRTLDEARSVVRLLAENGLERGRDGLRLVMMCELPSNAVLAEEFLQYFDGFSIGSNDLTQLTLGLDRDSGLVAAGFDERDGAVKAMLEMAIRACRKQGKYVGICGQGPSDHPDFARWLMEQGIESLSLNPDTVVSTWLALSGNAPALSADATGGSSPAATPSRAPTPAYRA